MQKVILSLVNVRTQRLSRYITLPSSVTFHTSGPTLRNESKMRHDTSGDATVSKYCAVCGRLISPHVRNFEERKYCSKSCSSTRLTDLDSQIEDEFVKLALRDGQVECREVQSIIGERTGRYHMLAVEQDQQTNLISAEKWQAIKTKQGNDEAAFRERVRRAARRVVVNGRDGEAFLCWSQGRSAEPSFAKGDWAVKHVKS